MQDTPVTSATILKGTNTVWPERKDIYQMSEREIMKEILVNQRAFLDRFSAFMQVLFDQPEFKERRMINQLPHLINADQMNVLRYGLSNISDISIVLQKLLESVPSDILSHEFMEMWNHFEDRINDVHALICSLDIQASA